MNESVVFISRQRLVGNTNGSSRYVLSIVEFLTSKGHAVHYVCPVKNVFGRWPFLLLRPEIDHFASYRIRDAVRIGRIVFNPNIRVWFDAALAAVDIIGRRLGLGLPTLGKVRTPPMHEDTVLTATEQAYLAQVAHPLADAILCDYGTMTSAIAAVGRPGSPNAVLMHELFASRDPAIDPADEAAMLRRSDMVIAIQEEEAARIGGFLGQAGIMVAPMAVATVSDAQPGRDAELLFIASKTPANIEGLNWFIDAVWPILRKARPDLVLNVAGTVARGMGPVPAGIRMLGLVSDLAPLYREAGVVISPLRSGTGLKIKLVEAMGQGKAIVGTATTAQGVEDIVSSAMLLVDQPEAFANAILRLADDEAERIRLGQASLAVARARFSPDVCYSPVLEHLLGASPRDRGAEQAPAVVEPLRAGTSR